MRALRLCIYGRSGCGPFTLSPMRAGARQFQILKENRKEGGLSYTDYYRAGIDMGMWIGRNRKARVTYGFDEIALVPGRVTINPNEVETTFRLPRRSAEPLELKIPIL